MSVFGILDLRQVSFTVLYIEGADKSLARPTSRYILFDGENISFDASVVV
jgi:homoserine trans-succinylase